MFNIVIWFAIAFTSIFTVYFLAIGIKLIQEDKHSKDLKPKIDSEIQFNDGYVLMTYAFFEEIKKLLVAQKNNVISLNENIKDVERINEKINSRVNDITNIENQKTTKSKIYDDILGTNYN